MEIIIIFPSVHHTLRAEEELQKTAYRFTVVPVPPFVNEGCGLGLKINGADREAIESLLADKGIEITKAHPL
ncbi:MAG: DUF3343 domain-containing protein [Clostridia bacterium]|jgi:hypothetical protein|nr:DUF3343 domain-containing protein [Clostridia bacterium]